MFHRRYKLADPNAPNGWVLVLVLVNLILANTKATKGAYQWMTSRSLLG